MTVRRTAYAQTILDQAEQHMAPRNLACVEPRRARSGYAQQISLEALKTVVGKSRLKEDEKRIL
jgi:hypothetical protein